MQFLTEITNLLLFLMKIATLRMKIVKYECTLACNSRHFNNFIGNNCFNYTHKCSFSWALIWYKILCDIIYPLGCKGEAAESPPPRKPETFSAVTTAEV